MWHRRLWQNVNEALLVPPYQQLVSSYLYVWTQIIEVPIAPLWPSWNSNSPKNIVKSPSDSNFNCTNTFFDNWIINIYFFHCCRGCNFHKLVFSDPSSWWPLCRHGYLSFYCDSLNHVRLMDVGKYMHHLQRYNSIYICTTCKDIRAYKYHHTVEWKMEFFKTSTTHPGIQNHWWWT